MPSVNLARKELIAALNQCKELNVNIFGIDIKRQPLLAALRLNTQEEIITLCKGHLTWPSAPPDRDLDLEGSAGIDEDCLQITLDHTIMRFLNRPERPGRAAYLNIITAQSVTPDGLAWDVRTFAPALNQAMTCAAKSEDRPVLNGVCFTIKDKTLELCGADGFRLVLKRLAISGKVKDCRFILPLFDLAKVAQLLKAAKPIGKGKARQYPSVYMAIGKDDVTFTCQYNKVMCLKIQGNYPQYEQLIPKDGTRIDIAPDLALDAIKNVGIVSKDASSIVRLIVKVGKLTASSVSEELGASSA
jgi:hypothetical protein